MLAAAKTGMALLMAAALTLSTAGGRALASAAWGVAVGATSVLAWPVAVTEETVAVAGQAAAAAALAMWLAAASVRRVVAMAAMEWAAALAVWTAAEAAPGWTAVEATPAAWSVAAVVWTAVAMAAMGRAAVLAGWAAGGTESWPEERAAARTTRAGVAAKGGMARKGVEGGNSVEA